MSRGIAKRPSTLEDHETTSVGELTAYKANLITREYGLDEEQCGLRQELKVLTLACTLKQKDLSFKM